MSNNVLTDAISNIPVLHLLLIIGLLGGILYVSIEIIELILKKRAKNQGKVK